MTSEIRSALAGHLSDSTTYRPDGSWDEAASRASLDQLSAKAWTRVGLAEALGGEGGDLSDVREVVLASAYAGLRSPLVDIVVISNSLLASANIVLPSAQSRILPVPARGTELDNGQIAVKADRVPWASWATHFLVPVVSERGSYRVAMIDAADAHIETGVNLLEEPRERVVVDAVNPITLGQFEIGSLEAMLRLGALARAIQISGALERILDITISYCLQRRQFGKTLASLAVVQQELAALAGEVSAAHASVGLAVDAMSSGNVQAAARAVAVAKVRTGMAATAGARSAHQLHGAIGVTREYELHRHTCALWCWREEYGAEQFWARAVATDLVGRADVWSSLADPETVQSELP